MYNNRIGTITFAMVVGLSCMKHAQAQNYFHMGLLEGGGGVPQHEGLTAEEYIEMMDSSAIPPGVYEMGVVVNRDLIASTNIKFVSRRNDNGGTNGKSNGKANEIYPCLSKEDLYDFGVLTNGVDTFASNGDQCVVIDSIDDMRYEIDWLSRQFVLSVPQLYIDKEKAWEARKDLWDEGINHAFANYNFFSYKRNGDRENHYLNLRSGFNLGSWRYRNYSVWRNGAGTGPRWSSITNTVSRNIIPIEGELTLGDLHTNSKVFSGVRMRGVNLRRNDQMRPSWENSYVPSISGIANSDSVITISQGGNVIYSGKIPAGPYAITDYYPASYGGELQVRLEGIEGQVTEYLVPFASIPALERRGRFTYDASIGRYHSDAWAGTMSKGVAQIDLRYGLTDYTTVYGGLQATSDYQAYALGAGQNLGIFGALAADITTITYKRKDLPQGQNRHHNAQSVQINYAKGIAQTSTYVIVDWRKALDNKYLTLTDAMNGAYSYDSEKDQFGLSLNQNLPVGWGSFSGSAYQVKYQSGTKINTYSLAYSNSYKGISYGLYWQKNQNHLRSLSGPESISLNENQIMLTVSIPLSRYDTPMWAGYNISRDSARNVRQEINVSGTALDHKLNWSARHSHGNHGYSHTEGVNASYAGRAGTVSAGYSYAHSDRSNNMNFGVSGALTLSEYGIVLSPELGQASALVVVPNAAGVEISNTRGIRTNSQGLAVLTHMSSYRNNRVALVPGSLPVDVDVEGTINTNLYPTKGAMILSRFNTERGYKTIFSIQNPELPIGARAYINGDLNSEPVLIGGFNQLFAVLPDKQGVIDVQWNGKTPLQQCRLHYDLENLVPISGYYYTETQCLKESATNE